MISLSNVRMTRNTTLSERNTCRMNISLIVSIVTFSLIFSTEELPSSASRLRTCEKIKGSELVWIRFYNLPFRNEPEQRNQPRVLRLYESVLQGGLQLGFT